MSKCPECRESENGAVTPVPNFALAGFGQTGSGGEKAVKLDGVRALRLQICVSASYNPGTNQICFSVPIYGDICVTSPIPIPIGGDLSACAQTCGSIIPSGLKVTISLNGVAIYTGVVVGSC